ncbi:glycosyltransferase [Alteromonas mediterranea]|uniref:glycosyltransferase n=1 Tax=Alteromonas mediterranea TaxID=314275 RepID=UPI0032B2D354
MTSHGKTLLMIAFEFPPSNGASVPRIESFYRYLKQWGWKVVVLTASSKAYQRIDNSYQDGKDDLVYRAMALDVPRHLSIKGKYLSSLEMPDRWGLTWIPCALVKGKKLLKQYKPDVVWSSSPIPSTHYIAQKLSSEGNIPWVADYRDPFHYMNGSAGKRLDKQHRKIDSQTLKQASKLTFATQQVRDLYCKEYGELVSKKSMVIENGFDESNFKKLAELPAMESPFSPNKFSLYYSGVLYAHGRDPKPIFNALALLQSEGKINEDNFELIFQGAGDGQDFLHHLDGLGIAKLVKFIPPVSFIYALSNMMQCNALLLIQDERFDKQIPGKLYEYLRTQKPLLVKSPTGSATQTLAANHAGVVSCYSEAESKFALLTIIEQKKEKINRDLEKHSREQKAKEMNHLLLTL